MAFSPPTTTTTTSLFLVFLFLSPLPSTPIVATSDTAALTQFLSQTNTHTTFLLTNWTASTDACSASWHGIKCTKGRVTSLSLPSFSLRGSINSLSHLSQLRVLNLQNNRLNSSLLPITNCTNLKLLYLTNNDFSEQIPSSIGSLHRLVRLDLSNNNLGGSLPKQIFNLTRLVTLRLQNNLLSGKLPDLSSVLPKLGELNVTNNQLSGHLPEALQRKFGEGSFVGNPGLCGLNPLPICSFTTTTTAPSNPSSFPGAPIVQRGQGEARNKISIWVIVAIVVGNIVALLVIVLIVVAYLRGRSSKREDSNHSCEEKVYRGNGALRQSAGEHKKLVFFYQRKVFELEELLRASAEMLGKGCLGTVYRAMLDEDCVVAVKRLRDLRPCAKEEFERYMDLIGNLRHRNIVCFMAYYYTKEEKLLVYDFLPNGSLHSLLHGNRGPGRIPLDWTTRISLVLGAAHGLAHIHEEYNALKIPHGNVKSSNVLVDKNGVACISDFGLALLLSPVQATARLGGYGAPEQAKTKKLSQKADVYSFGVLVLEVLTGRAPNQSTSPYSNEQQGLVDISNWVRSVVKDEWTVEVFDAELLRYKNIEEELVKMLHVGLACVAEEPEKRPTMREVTKIIDDIFVEQSPLGEDLEGSHTSVSPSNTGTQHGRACC